MHCSHCNTHYALYTYYRNRKGITETCHGWVQKPLLQELAGLNERMEEEKKGIATYLREQYGENWIQHFHRKTKKTIWSELTQDGRTYPQLSTFYTHIRDSGLGSVLESYLEYREAGTVIRALELNDIKLTAILARVRKLEELIEQKEQHVRRNAGA